MGRAREMLEDLGAKIEEWKRGERPPIHIVLGCDANAQVERDVENVTGGVTWEEAATQRDAKKRQGRLVVEWCAELLLRMLNTYHWEGARPPGIEEDAPPWTWMGAEAEKASARRDGGS